MKQTQEKTMEKCKLGHDYGFTKGIDILIGKGRKRYKCIVCGFEETEKTMELEDCAVGSFEAVFETFTNYINIWKQ